MSTPCAGGRSSNFVVDTHFVEQFEIAKPTARYTRILGCIPRVLVLPEERCPPLVTFLCAELAVAFKACGTVVPPWRQVSPAVCAPLTTTTAALEACPSLSHCGRPAMFFNPHTSAVPLWILARDLWRKNG